MYTPFELVFGRKRYLSESSTKLDPIYNIENYYLELKYRLQHAHKVAVELINKSKNNIKIQHDKHARPLQVQVGDKVLLCNNRHKHDAMYSGPYIMIDVN